MLLDKSHPQYLCQRCGNCCRWPGDVIVSEAEVDKIAGHLGMEVGEFVQKFTRLSANRRHLSLVDQGDGACIFLEGKNTCRIQPVKPAQCGGFPNLWRFEGWREICEAVEVATSPEYSDNSNN